MVARPRLCAVNTGTPFDYVEINLQNALFAEDEFGHRHQRGLNPLAKERAARPEEQVFHQLLRNGGSSAETLAFQILFRIDLDLLPIESMVLVEARVLCRDYGVLKIDRNFAERNEFIA